MKSVKKENEKVEVTIKFPCLMVLPDTGTVILATGKADVGFEGTIIYSSAGFSEVGRSSNGWSARFVPFDGEVTLSND